MHQLPNENLEAIADRVQAQPEPLNWSWVAMRRPPNVDLFAASLRTEGLAELRIYDYGRIVITRELLAPHDAAARLRDRVAGVVDVGGRQTSVELGTQLISSAGYILSTGQVWGPGPTPEWPTYYLEWPLSPSAELLWAAQLDQPLIRPGQPPYERAEDGIYELLYAKKLERPAIQRVAPSITFRMANRRARIQPPSIAGRELVIPIDLTTGSAAYTLQGTWTEEGGPQRTFEQPIALSQIVSLPLEGDHIVEYYVALLDPSGEWCDEQRYRESPLQKPLSRLISGIRAHDEAAQSTSMPTDAASGQPTPSPANVEAADETRDLFISHAGEDKQDYVRPLANALQAAGLRVWYDEFELKPGDSLRRSIDRGLRQATIAVVVLSPSFFGKKWPEHELNGIVQHFDEGNLIPIWHHIDHAEVERYSASLADTIAIKSDLGIPYAVNELRKAVARQTQSMPSTPPANRSTSAEPDAEAVATTLERVQSALTSLKTNGASLVLGLASSPLREAQRASAFADGSLRRRLLKEAIFGSHHVFDPSTGSTDKLAGDDIVLEQLGRVIRCNAIGSVVIAIPAVERTAPRASLPSLIKEEVVARLANLLEFSHELLEILDPTGLWNQISVIAALRACQGLGWRTQSEAEQAPNSLSLNLRSADAQAGTQPARLPRSDLQLQSTELAEDLTELLRRQLQGER